jgi:TonB-linked SusC/RagA family outer membrane protein
MKKNLLILLLSIFALSSAFAQNRKITGTVTGADDGQPLPGVSVTIPGTNVGTQTGTNGDYSVSVPATAKALVFKYVGYDSQTVTLGTKTAYNVVLLIDTKTLKEVVVTTSFGIDRSKKSLGYGTTTISSESVNATQNTNFTNSLDGKIPGVQVSGTGGAFTGANILIRGNITFTGSNQPLIIIDGLPVNNNGGQQPLQAGPSNSNRGIDVNPEDIENVVVLKSAAATVLYGSRAASGAILITTKKGKKGKAKVDFTSSYSAGTPDRLPTYQNTYGQGNNGIYNNTQTTSWGPQISGQLLKDFFGNTVPLQAYPDNVKNFFVTANTFQNNLSLSGANDVSNYRVSYGNDQDAYVIADNHLYRNNFTVNYNTQLSPKLKIGTSFSYVNTTSKRTQQGNQLSNPLFRGYFTPRSYDLQGLPFEDANGKQTWFGTFDNPYWTLEHNRYNDEVNRIFGNVNLNYEITPWLTANLKLGEDAFSQTSIAIDDIGNLGGGNAGSSSVGVGGLVTTASTVRSTQEYFTLTANKKYGDFNFSLTVGNEYLDQYQNANSVTAYTLALAGFENLSNATNLFPANAFAETRTFGFFGDFVVDYKNFFSINIKARDDLLSTLPVNNQSVFYPAIAAAFNLTEAFPSLKSKTINQIKLRANFGVVGKGPGAYLTALTYGKAGSADGFGPAINFPFNGQSGFSLNTGAGNPAIQPEFTRELELGGEFAFFNNRLSIDASYYHRHSDHIIFSVPLPNSTGLSSFLENAGVLNTTGYEAGITGVPVKTKDVQWTVGLNYSHNVSTVESLAPNVTNIFLGGFTTPNIRLVAGDQYGQIYGAAYQRDAKGNVLIQGTGANAGLPLSTTGVQKIGNPNPKYLAGITNSVTYKGFNLYFLIDIKVGGDQYSRNIADVQRNGVAIETAAYPRFDGSGVATTPYLFTGVYSTGPNVGQANTTMVTAQQYYGNAGKYVAAEGFIYDTSWYRLREATLSYNIPSSLLAHTFISKASLGVYGRNLILITPHYKHFDPEQNATGIGNPVGLEFNSLPNVREIGVNLKISL